MKQKLLILLSLVLIGFVSIGVHDLRKHEKLDSLKQIQLDDNLIEIKKLELEKSQIREDFDEASKQKELDTKKLQELEQRDIEKDKQIEELKKQVQAKKDAQTVASVGVTQKVAAAPARPAVSGSKAEWLAQSGIPEDQWWAVDSIVSRESGWKPCAYNPGRNDCSANPTSACGLAQALPCGKQAKYGHWTDPVANLKWQYEYVTARYGGYPQAVAFWNANHWY